MYICISSYNNQELEISEKGDFPLEKQTKKKQISSTKEETKKSGPKKIPTRKDFEPTKYARRR